MAKLNEICSKFLDLALLTVYWFVSCLPVFTIGTATSALYYTTQKVIKNDRGYVSGEYWHFFKENFKVSTKCWLVHLILGFVFADEAYICYQMWRDGVTIGWMWIPFVVMEVLNVIMAIFTLTYIARFEDGVKRTLKNAFFIMMTHLVKVSCFCCSWRLSWRWWSIFHRHCFSRRPAGLCWPVMCWRGFSGSICQRRIWRRNRSATVSGSRSDFR